jgi:hypothetical protein
MRSYAWAGCWCVLDQANELDPALLSIVAQQI